MELTEEEQRALNKWPEVVLFDHKGQPSLGIFAKYDDPDVLHTYAEKVNGVTFGVPIFILFVASIFMIGNYLSHGGALPDAFLRYGYLTGPLVVVIVLWIRLAGDTDLRHRVAWHQHPTRFNIIINADSLIVNGETFSSDQNINFHAVEHRHAEWERRRNQTRPQKIALYSSHYFQDSVELWLKTDLNDIPVAAFYSPHGQANKFFAKINGIMPIAQRLQEEARQKEAYARHQEEKRRREQEEKRRQEQARREQDEKRRQEQARREQEEKRRREQEERAKSERDKKGNSPNNDDRMTAEKARRILDLGDDWDCETLKKQYRGLSAKFHPDREPGSNYLQEQINVAYQLLKKLKNCP